MPYLKFKNYIYIIFFYNLLYYVRVLIFCSFSKISTVNIFLALPN